MTKYLMQERDTWDILYDKHNNNHDDDVEEAVWLWLWFIMLRKSSSKEVCDLLRFLRGAATLHKRIFVQNTEKRACARALIKS